MTPADRVPINDLMPPGLAARLAAIEDALGLVPPPPRRVAPPEVAREYAAAAAANSLAGSDESPAAEAVYRRAGRALAAYADEAVRPEFAALVREALGDLAGDPPPAGGAAPRH